MSSVQQTGLGYRYFRDRSGGTDTTVYIHQLVALLEYPPSVVFDPNTDIHHKNHLRFDNRIENLEPRDSREHRTAHLEGTA